MQVSAEIRWFWSKVPPPNLEKGFRNAAEGACAAGGGETRVNEYLFDPNQRELNLKCRGGKTGVEIKGLVAAHFGAVASNPFVGPIELWTKWTSECLKLASGLTVPIEKVRWLRKFDTAKQFPEEIPIDRKERPIGGRALSKFGCNVEFVRITLSNNAIWRTLGFESFGTVQTAEKASIATAMTLAARRPPEFRRGELASYTVWLTKNVVTNGMPVRIAKELREA